MQPEDLIQAKEWSQLTEEDKAALAPLAATEGEYNVLKKALLIATEDAAHVPLIAPAVRQRLHSHLPKPVAAKRRTIWWAAAAIVATLLAAALFLLPKKMPVDTANRAKTSLPQRPMDTQTKEPVPPKLPVSTDAVVAKTDTARRLQHKTPLPKNGATHSHDAAQVNTSVGGNENLLAFVTEVY